MGISMIGREGKPKGKEEKPASVDAFRRRIAELIATRCDGKYTLLAKRAGIPVSTMQHYMHSAKYIPGGEHVARIAEALGVTTDYLITGSNVIRTSDLLAHPVVFPEGGIGEMNRLERHIEVPVFDCTCPSDCVFAHEPIPVETTEAKVYVPVELVPHWDRLVGFRIIDQRFAWKVGTRIIIDWGARSIDAENDKFLYRANGSCQLGRLHEIEGGHVVLFPLSAPGGPDVATPMPRILPRERLVVLGKIVAVIGPP